VKRRWDKTAVGYCGGRYCGGPDRLTAALQFDRPTSALSGIANELVEWFNQVDATYRADLRELNELNFQRFDAKLEQRLADLRTEFHRELGSAKADLIKSYLYFWTPVVLGVIGLYFKK
jgi:hypothetical protein